MVGKIDLRYVKTRTALLIGCLLQVYAAQAGKLSIVIDDVGYRPHERKRGAANADGDLGRGVAQRAACPPDGHPRPQPGREVLIHMPMAPLSKQPLERDTLQPSMSSDEIQRIIRNAVNNVPYAVGMNNHMGSAMTSSLPGMQKVMQALESYRLYFLDSMTIGSSQRPRRGRHRRESDQTQGVSRRYRERSRHPPPVQPRGRIGAAQRLRHRHRPPAPGDGKGAAADAAVAARRYRAGQTERAAERTAGQCWRQLRPTAGQTAKPQPKNPFSGGIKQCKVKPPKEKTNAGTALGVIADSIASSPPVTFIKRHWQHWTQAKPQ